MTSIRSICRLEYRAPGYLDEALGMLRTSGTGVRILAGGTDLIVQMKQGLLLVFSSRLQRGFPSLCYQY